MVGGGLGWVQAESPKRMWCLVRGERKGGREGRGAGPEHPVWGFDGYLGGGWVVVGVGWGGRRLSCTS
eukprot:43733-Chlamydomonas_euryale.AAC.11